MFKFPKKIMKTTEKKILIYQQELLGKIPENDKETIKAAEADIVSLPEYFFHPEIVTYEESIELMEEYSLYFNCILIGGTTVLNKDNKLFNCCYIFNKGKNVGYYAKIHLFKREIGIITPGTDYKTYNVDGLNIGLMICADALYSETWEELSNLNPDIIFAPTFSPYKEESTKEKFKRDEDIYVKGAKKTNCPVVKICCVGKFRDTRLQGRSLVAKENKIIWRVDPEDEDKPQIKIIKLNI